MIALWAIGGILWILLLFGLVSVQELPWFKHLQPPPWAIAFGIIFWPSIVIFYILYGLITVLQLLWGDNNEDGEP